MKKDTKKYNKKLNLNRKVLINLKLLKHSYTTVYYICVLLKKTGLRPIEVLEPNRWTIINEKYYSVKLAKNNGLRRVNQKLIPDYIKYLYALKPTLKSIYSLKTLNKYILQNSIYTFRNGNKNIVSYIFRHNYIKRLKSKGLTNARIQKKMKHSDIKNTLNYINSNIITID